MEKMYKVLFIDDDKRYAEPLIERAFTEHNLDLQHCEDWEEGKSLLETNPGEYHALIIDGKGKLKQDDKGDNPKHLSIALSDLKDLRAKGIYIQYVINTAYYDEFSKYFDDEKMVDKNNPDKLFSILRELITSNDVEKIKTKYANVFECFGSKYLPIESSSYLLEVLMAVDKNSWSTNSFTSLRKIIEAIYKKLHTIDDVLIPDSCMNFDKGTVNFEYCARRLFSGKDIQDKNKNVIIHAIPPVVPEHLGWLIQPLDKICSICSHDYKDVRYINIYSLKTILFGVMEMMLWLKIYIDEH